MNRPYAVPALALALLALAAPTRVAAQVDPSCTYDACAVRIDYSFFGAQHLVRGAAAERVASISPFSSTVRAALAGSDSATVYAATYQEKYRWGSTMAFAGSVIGAATLFLAGDDFSEVDIAFTITGFGISLVGGWLVTSAFDDLNDAIWHYNREFSDAE